MILPDVKSRVLMGMPMYESVKPQSCQSADATVLQGLMRGVHVRWVIERGTLVHIGRNKILNSLLDKKPFDWLLFADADMAWKASTVWRMIEHNKDIVGALYFKRLPPHTPVYAKELLIEEGDVQKVSKLPPRGLSKVDGLGMGLTLISRKVCEAVKAKYPRPFQFMEIRGGTSELSEDYTFCWRAKQLGFQAWIDFDPEDDVQHGGNAFFGLNDYEMYERDRAAKIMRESASKVRAASKGEVRELAKAGGRK